MKGKLDARAKAVADARAIQDRAEREGRAISADEQVEQRRLLDEVRRLSGEIEIEQELLEAERLTGAPESQRSAARGAGTAEGDRRAAYSAAFRSYILNGFAGLSPAEQSIMRSGYRELTAEERAQSVGVPAAGGFTVAPDTSFYGRILEAQKFFGGMLTCGATVLTTDGGGDLPMPSDDDTANVGAIVAENGSHTGGTDVALSQKTLRAWLYSSKMIKISWQLLQDSAIDWEAYVGRKLGQRIGRIQNTHLTTGTGAGQPQGIVTGASVGRQSASGFTAAVAYDDLIRLEHSVDKAYRQSGKYMTSDTTALALRLLKDGNGQYLWKQGDGSQPDRLNGYPVVINNDMPAMATSAKHTVFGDTSAYHIRQVKGITIARAGELYMENGQIGILAFARLDGGLIDAGQGPVKALQNSAA